jgi:hypothetical protein
VYTANMDEGLAAAEQRLNLESQNTVKKSLAGGDLPANWPQIMTNKAEIKKAYGILKDKQFESPKYPHIEKLSYELSNGQKRLRFFATYHQKDMIGPSDHNMIQYEILEKKFYDSPPQLVLYEGIIDNVNVPITRERALILGEQTWMLYLVQQHNSNLVEGEKPIVIESGDKPVNSEPDDEKRDKYIVENAASKFKQYDRIDIVFGSGHAIREERAWRDFFRNA